MSIEEKKKYTDSARKWKQENKDKWNTYQREVYLKSVGGELSRMSPLEDAEIKKEHRRKRKAETVYNWQQTNPDKMKLRYLKDKSSGQSTYRAAKRRASKKQATPAWADLEAIKDVYKEARYMQMHVDHIYPLQSDWVCGLHVWDNLQLLPASVNIAKGNRHVGGGL